VNATAGRASRGALGLADLSRLARRTLRADRLLVTDRAGRVVAADGPIGAAGPDEITGGRAVDTALLTDGGRRVGTVRLIYHDDAPVPDGLIPAFAPHLGIALGRPRLSRPHGPPGGIVFPWDDPDRLPEAINEITGRVAEVVRPLTGATAVGITVWDAERGILTALPEAFGATDAMLAASVTGPPTNMLSASVRVFVTGEPYLSNQASGDPGVLQSYVEMFDIHRMLSVPLDCGDRRVGVLHLINKPDGFTTADTAAVESVSPGIAAGVQLARSVARMAGRQRLEGILAAAAVAIASGKPGRESPLPAFDRGRGRDSIEGEGEMKLYPLQIDPPYQTRWRAALGSYFNAKAVARIEDSVREHANYLIDGFIAAGECDFVDCFAAQLPARVFFGSFLGLPFEQIKPIQKATDDAIRGPGEGRAAAWATVGGFLNDYLGRRAAEAPQGDFVDVVLAGVKTDEGEPAPYEHKLYIVVDFLAGGIGTTSHTLASMVHHLATHPDHVKRLIAEPELHDNVVEEIIRIHAPVAALGLTATVETEVAGQRIKAGDLVMLCEGAACRDPQVTPNPGVVDLDRRVPVNLAFSYGPHRCIGAHVAGGVMRVALGEVLRRMPDVALAPGRAPVFSNSGVSRNMDTLPLVFAPGSKESP